MSWILMISSAALIGMSKTGIQGMAIPAVALMAAGFGAKESTGVILPLLCMADVIAVIYYRRTASFNHVLKLLPMALAGFVLALMVDSLIPAQGFRYLMGGCLTLCLILMFVSDRSGKSNPFAGKWWFGAIFGLLGGFTTMIGNAAGPVMAVYLMSMRLPKLVFVGTNAWFFLTINALKLPIQYYAWDNINFDTVVMDLKLLPFIALGAVFGIFIVRLLPENKFRLFTQILTFMSVLMLVFYR